MKKIINLFRYLRYESYKFGQDQQILQKIKTQGKVGVEYPFFQIEGPEYITIGKGSSIGKHAWVACYDKYHDQQFHPQLLIGDNVRIGNYSCITAVSEIIIGDGCLFSDYVYISDHAHSFNPDTPLVEQPLEFKGNVNIGSNCFVGMRVSILPNVTLGSNCIVGAHSVVTRSFPPNSMIAGNPAQLIKKL